MQRKMVVLCVLVASLNTAAIIRPATSARAATDAVLCNGNTAGEWACAGGGYSGSSRSWADRYYFAGTHNCTRYAAHRLKTNGYGDPGTSWGNAWEWATRAPGTKDGTPAVGAIANWNKSSLRPAGHVAYVEEVGSDYIVITEDNWRGVTYRRRIATGSSNWPNRFIHIKDVTGPDAATPRIGVLLSNGDFLVKEGRLDAAWVLENGAGKQISLTSTRIGYVTTGGAAYVKEGGLDAAWVKVAGDTTSMVLSGNRIGILQTNGDYYVKEGRLDAAWVLENGAGTDICLNEACALSLLPTPTPTQPADDHVRLMTFALRRHLIASGRIAVPDGYEDCATTATVKIQRRGVRSWVTVARVESSAAGRYSMRIADWRGRYRAVAAPTYRGANNDDVCLRAVSSVTRHSH